MSSFSVTLKLFAIYQEVMGVDELTLEVAAGTQVGQVCEILLQKYPVLEPWRRQTRFAVNLDFVSENTDLQPNDEVALIPPVSGG
jgi:molybdopterin synthase sulfur carrier subunit